VESNKLRAMQEELLARQREVDEKEAFLVIKRQELKKAETDVRAALGAMALKHIDTLLILEPAHACINCSDSNPCNAIRARCTRCVLLVARRDNYWDDENLLRPHIEWCGDR
jgi:hypothetical protein